MAIIAMVAAVLACGQDGSAGGAMGDGGSGSDAGRPSGIDGSTGLDSGPAGFWNRETVAIEGTHKKIAVDPAGNVLVGGDTAIALGKTSQHGAGVMKFAPAGNHAWFGWVEDSMAVFSSQSAVLLFALATDRQGNAFAAGTTNYSFPGEPPLAMTPERRHFGMFVAKFDPDGRRSWIRQLGTHPGMGTGSSFQVRDIAADTTGNVVIAATYSGAPLLEFSEQLGSLVVWYSADGATRKVHRVTQNPVAVAADGGGQTYVLGHNAILKVDGAGEIVATIPLTSSVAASTPRTIHVASDGNTIYVGGDKYLARLDGAGVLKWRQDVTENDKHVEVVVSRTDGARVFVGGHVNYTKVIEAYDGAGTRLWSKEYPREMNDMDLGPDGELFVLARGAHPSLQKPHPKYDSWHVLKLDPENGEIR